MTGAMHAANALVLAATKWPTASFKTDPAWCMRYLELTADFLTAHRTFCAEQPLMHAINAGLRTSDKLRDDCWCEGFDMIMRLGWAVPLPERTQGSKQWMSLL